MARIGNLRSSYAMPQTPWQDEAPKQETPPLAEGSDYTPPQGALTPSQTTVPPKDVPAGVSGFSSPQSQPQSQSPQPRVTAPEGYWQQQLASIPKLGEKKPATADDLIAQWEAEDARKQAEYERSRRAHSALDNIFKGYEAFFNSMAVRKGALSTPSASSQEQQAAQDRFARYQQDRAERKEAYTRKMAKLRQDQEDAHNDAALAYKLTESARQKEKDDNMMKLYYDRLEEQKRKAGAQEDLNARKQQHYEEKDAATLDLNERKFNEQQSLNAHRAQALDAQAASAYARASGGSSSPSSASNKIYSAAGWTYDMPKNMSEGSFKRMQLDIMAALDISEQEPVMKESGKKDKNGKPIMEQAKDFTTGKPVYRKRTPSEIAGLINKRWNTKAGDIVRSYGGTVRETNSLTGKKATRNNKMTRPQDTPSSSPRPSMQGRMKGKGNKAAVSLDITK